MQFIKVGVDYQTTPLHIREKLSITESDVEQVVSELKKREQISECVVLSTCNRTEIFAVVEDEKSGIQEVIKFFAEWFQVNQSDILPHLKFVTDEDVAHHTLKLTAGLDSMVLGETQILGQVRQAFLTAQQNKTTGKHFNELFRRAITFGKQVHTETVIGKQAVSISYVAVELSKKIFDDMNGKHAVIIGAGEMGEASLKNLHGAGVSKITIVNRSYGKLKQLAHRYEAETASLDELDQVLLGADILISSTGANGFILTKERLQHIQEQRKYEPLLIIDIAVPRDIEDSAADIKNIHLYDIDDLQSVSDENMERRKEVATLIESDIEEEIDSYREWLNMQEVTPIIKALQDKSSRIQEQTLNSIYRKIPDLDEREKKVLEKHTKSIVHQLLEQPLEQLKQIGAASQSDDVKEMYKAMFIDIFGLENSQNDKEQSLKSEGVSSIGKK